MNKTSFLATSYLSRDRRAHGISGVVLLFQPRILERFHFRSSIVCDACAVAMVASANYPLAHGQ
jgi:hypothetical protein